MIAAGRPDRGIGSCRNRTAATEFVNVQRTALHRIGSKRQRAAVKIEIARQSLLVGENKFTAVGDMDVGCLVPSKRFP